jgi:glycosyltransferase involved in cell wall biosynthesis
MNIFLGYDDKCLSKEKVLTGKVGGTERFFLLLEKYLKAQGHKVNSSNKYNIAIHSNWTTQSVNATYQVCWCGSWTTDACDSKYDLVIANSQYMLDKLKIKGTVIPACYEAKIEEFKLSSNYIDKRIVTTSNPNRYFLDALKVIDLLHKNNTEFSWIITGGNKLYSDKFSEQFQVREDSSIIYKGILNREEMLKELTAAHVFCYPNFSDNSETQCVAMIEASVLGIPVVLPKRRPFIDVLPDNPYFVENIQEFADVITYLLTQPRAKLKICDTSNYTEDIVFEQIDNALLTLAG